MVPPSVRPLQPCPICAGESGKLLLKKDNLDRIYNLVKCESCEQVMINPLPSYEQLEEYYNSEFSVPPFQERKIRRKGGKVLDLLQEMGLGEESSILDIGASHGFFLDEARNRGYSIDGVELSSDACQQAQDRLGITVENTSFEESSFSGHTDFFDSAVMLDVIEHVTRPKELINGISRTLKDGGFFVLTTPNISSFEYLLFGRHWEWINPPAHLFYFSDVTLGNLLRESGMEIVHIETYRGDSGGNLFFHAMYSLIKMLYASQKYIVGRDALLERKRGMVGKLNARNSLQNREFTGILGFLNKFSVMLNPILYPIESWRNRRSRGASLLIIGRKIGKLAD